MSVFSSYLSVVYFYACFVPPTQRSPHPRCLALGRQRACLGGISRGAECSSQGKKSSSLSFAWTIDHFLRMQDNDNSDDAVLSYFFRSSVCLKGAKTAIDRIFHTFPYALPTKCGALLKKTESLLKEPNVLRMNQFGQGCSRELLSSNSTACMTPGKNNGCVFEGTSGTRRMNI